MEIIYTKHAEDKLKRADNRRFKITKRLINKVLREEKLVGRTKYGEFATLYALDGHTLRVIYDRIGSDCKVITFHVARKGRYETKIL